MKRLHIVYCLPFISLMLICMDDDDLYNAPEEPEEYEQAEYFFPPLLKTYVYPIRMHRRCIRCNGIKSYINKPIFGDKKRVWNEKEWLEYKQGKQQIKKAYDVLLKGILDIQKRDSIIKARNVQIADLQKKHKNVCFGTFVIYAAINKEQRFKHPWYCIGTLNLQERVAAEIKCAEEADKRIVYTKPKTSAFKYTYIPPSISLTDKAECDKTLSTFVKVIAKQDVILCISYPTHYYGRLTKVIKETVNRNLQTTYDTACRGNVNTTDFSIKTYVYKWELERGECPMNTYKSGDADLRELYDFWPQHETKDRLRELVESNTIPFTPFSYTASPSSSSEDTSTVVLREVEVLTVNPNYSPASSSRNRFSNSTTYKLQ